MGLVPSSVRELTYHGQQVIVKTNAGLGIGIMDADAIIIPSPDEIFATTDMVVKVKEPQSSKCKLMRPGQILFTYLHLAADPRQTQELIDSDCIAIGYETVTSPKGSLPLLMPMSEVAGRMSIQVTW